MTRLKDLIEHCWLCSEISQRQLKQTGKHPWPRCSALIIVHAATGYAPYFLLFGWNPRLPIDLMFGLTVKDQGSSHRDYAKKWKDRMDLLTS